jgi:hypothetical protein
LKKISNYGKLLSCNKFIASDICLLVYSLKVQISILSHNSCGNCFSSVWCFTPTFIFIFSPLSIDGIYIASIADQYTTGTSWSYDSWIYHYLCYQYMTTKVVSSNVAHGKVFSMHLFMIKFVIDLQQICDFLQVLRHLRRSNCIEKNFKLREATFV